MSSESNLATFEQYLRSDLENLPLELFEEIVPYLNIPTIKTVSRASSILHKACIPLFFRSLSLYGDRGGLSKDVLTDLNKCTLIPSLRRVKLRWLKEYLSTALIPWCTRVHSIKIDECLVGNTALLPSLIVLKDLELSNLTFESVEDYFWLLASLPSTLRKLAVLGNTFRKSQSTCHAVGRGIELEHLETKSAEDFHYEWRPFLSRSHDLEDLVQRTPCLVDLCIDIKRREDQPVSFPLTRLKSLSIIDRTEPSDTVIQLLSVPNIASPLEVVNLSMVIYGWLSRMPLLVAAFSHPQFCKLNKVKIMLLASYANIRISPAILNDYARKFEHDLEATGDWKRIMFPPEPIIGLDDESG
ncbi:uncharacterized protein ARMOST_20396 [Armillaria ostoyae]|uniref:F-box domain-containing protein n=1 Tax=Armillaria ostoyae TaxID=47428 RepID=A0A284S7C4_ARMOS|nr:uncharacterized protein ARMOST_20396 [Armillaria ostoyae]